MTPDNNHTTRRLKYVAAVCCLVLGGWACQRYEYVFVPDMGSVSRGMPTAHAAPAFASDFPDGELPPVWPDPEGTQSGIAFSPLYKSATVAAGSDAALYELLAAVDCIRGGRAREKKSAIHKLRQRILDHGTQTKSQS